MTVSDFGGDFGGDFANSSPVMLSGKFIAIKPQTPIFFDSQVNRPNLAHAGDAGDCLFFGLDFTQITQISPLSLIFTRPDGTKLSASSPAVYVGQNDIDTYAGKMLASSYLVYVFQVGDLTVFGIWNVLAQFNGQIAMARFFVLP